MSKRRRSRTLRLSVSHTGQVRVSMPYWTPYSAGIMMINNHLEWLLAQLANTKKLSSVQESKLWQTALVKLPPRVAELSRQYNLKYQTLRIKKLTSRWGSCSSKGSISLSYYLLQLPEEMIDYVILHELAHTRYPHHGREFWAFMNECVPNLKLVRRQLRAYRPGVTAP